MFCLLFCTCCVINRQADRCVQVALSECFPLWAAQRLQPVQRLCFYWTCNVREPNAPWKTRKTVAESFCCSQLKLTRFYESLINVLVYKMSEKCEKWHLQKTRIGSGLNEEFPSMEKRNVLLVWASFAWKNNATHQWSKLLIDSSVNWLAAQIILSSKCLFCLIDTLYDEAAVFHVSRWSQQM